MKIPKPGGETTKRFDRLAETFVERGARRGQMLDARPEGGRQGVRRTYGDAMTFKLGPEDLERALKAEGVEPFEPMGRRMKEWALVPVEHSRRWSKLAAQAFAYLS